MGSEEVLENFSVWVVRGKPKGILENALWAYCKKFIFAIHEIIFGGSARL
jgi:hypothetical protein